MAKTTKNIGDFGEEIAVTFLKENKFVILARNYRFKRNEIDIIAMKDDFLHFIEVKCRSSVSFGQPESSVNAAKEERILECADAYLHENDWNGPICFDIISIILDKSGKTKKIDFLQDAIG